MSEQVPEDVNELDEAIVERLRNGTATTADQIAKLEYWRRNALDYDDTDRVATLDTELAELRQGE